MIQELFIKNFAIIEEVRCQFEKGMTVLTGETGAGKSIIIDAEAAIYDIVLNRYKKNYDMLLIGNIGEHGVEKIISEIKDSHNVYYFVKNPQYALNWQLPEDIVDYIRNNLKYHETVSVFDVYYKD